MATYQATSNDKLIFRLTQNDQLVGQLIYKSWFSFKAGIVLADNAAFQFEQKGFWGTTIELKDAVSTFMQFKMSWNGDIVIQANAGSKEQDFVFKHKGFLKSDTFVLVDRANQELLAIKPLVKWNKINYDYNMTTTDLFDRLDNQGILLLSMIYSANYFMSMMGGTLATAL